MFHGVNWMWQERCEYTANIDKPYGHMPSRMANDQRIKALEQNIAKCEEDIDDLKGKVQELSAEMTRRKKDRNDRRGGPMRSEIPPKRTQPY